MFLSELGNDDDDPERSFIIIISFIMVIHHHHRVTGRVTAIKQRPKVARGALIVVCVRDLYHFINLFMLTFINSCFNVVLSKQAMAEEASGCAAMDTVSPVPSLRWRWNK